MFFERSALKKAICQFFEERGFVEIETPILVSCPGSEVHLDYFSTEWTTKDGALRPLFLRSSPELHMKQALGDGYKKVFQLAKSFRNHSIHNRGEHSAWHHPEFTKLEWYEIEISYQDFITETEDLLWFTFDLMNTWYKKERKATLPFKKRQLRRLTVKEAFKEFAKIDLIDHDPDLASKGRGHHILSLNKNDDFETAFFKIMLEKIEPAFEQLGGVVLYDYPPSQAALSKIEQGIARRFEFYIGRVELCNGFSELLGVKENKERFKNALEKRALIKKEPFLEDEDFYHVLEKGLPPCCGNALGLDRWLAILLGKNSIDEVIPFRNARCWR